jgi:hypothetical protein
LSDDGSRDLQGGRYAYGGLRHQHVPGRVHHRVGTSSGGAYGDGGQRLHEWAFGEDERNREFFERSISELGVVIAGRKTYDDSLA